MRIIQNISTGHQKDTDVFNIKILAHVVFIAFFKMSKLKYNEHSTAVVEEKQDCFSRGFLAVTCIP
jgi:hypothetical protein